MFHVVGPFPSINVAIDCIHRCPHAFFLSCLVPLFPEWLPLLRSLQYRHDQFSQAWYSGSWCASFRIALPWQRIFRGPWASKKIASVSAAHACAIDSVKSISALAVLCAPRGRCSDERLWGSRSCPRRQGVSSEYEISKLAMAFLGSSILDLNLYYFTHRVRTDGTSLTTSSASRSKHVSISFL